MQSNIFLSGIVNLEMTEQGLVAVSVEEPLTVCTTTLIFAGKEGEDDENALYAQHAILEARMAQVARLIDERHAKRVTVQPKTGVIQ